MSPPTADDVALAIVLAAREFDEDPEAVARGAPNMASRSTAYRALMFVFLGHYEKSIIRLVGGGKDFLKHFEKGLPRDTRRKQRYAIAIRIAERIIEQRERPVRRLSMRIAPARRADNVTASLMGDPPPGRSALAQQAAE
jgi:hypothetical protein